MVVIAAIMLLVVLSLVDVVQTWWAVCHRKTHPEGNPLARPIVRRGIVPMLVAKMVVVGGLSWICWWSDEIIPLIFFVAGTAIAVGWNLRALVNPDRTGKPSS